MRFLCSLHQLMELFLCDYFRQSERHYPPPSSQRHAVSAPKAARARRARMPRIARGHSEVVGFLWVLNVSVIMDSSNTSTSAAGLRPSRRSRRRALRFFLFCISCKINGISFQDIIPELPTLLWYD